MSAWQCQTFHSNDSSPHRNPYCSPHSSPSDRKMWKERHLGQVQEAVWLTSVRSHRKQYLLLRTYSQTYRNPGSTCPVCNSPNKYVLETLAFLPFNICLSNSPKEYKTMFCFSFSFCLTL